MSEVIHWELCKKFRFDHTNKWHMHNPESILENETHKILLISARRPNLVIVNNNNKKKREPAK